METFNIPTLTSTSRYQKTHIPPRQLIPVLQGTWTMIHWSSNLKRNTPLKRKTRPLKRKGDRLPTHPFSSAMLVLQSVCCPNCSIGDIVSELNMLCFFNGKKTNLEHCWIKAGAPKVTCATKKRKTIKYIPWIAGCLKGIVLMMLPT